MQKAALDAGETDSADRAMLLELNRNYVRSALESDVRWYAENLSEDFYITAPDGALLDRDAFLERIAKPLSGDGGGGRGRDDPDSRRRRHHPFRFPGQAADR